MVAHSEFRRYVVVVEQLFVEPVGFPLAGPLPGINDREENLVVGLMCSKRASALCPRLPARLLEVR